MMKPGAVIEAAIWLGGTETEAQLDKYSADVLESMSVAAKANGCALSLLRWRTKKPGDDRVPVQPDHITGPDVRLLVCEATLVPIISSNFLADLDPKDLILLRDLTRRAYARARPAEPPLADKQCDTVINDLGPDAAVAALERGEATIQ